MLRGELRRFAIGAVVSGFAATAVLNVISPDALIARTNLTRPHVDVVYLARLSDDAVPTLVDRLATVPDPAVRRELAQRLLARSVDGQSLLSWNARAAGRAASCSSAAPSCAPSLAERGRRPAVAGLRVVRPAAGSFKNP